MVGAIVDQDHAAGPMVLCVHHFAEKLRVLGVNLAGEHALLVELLRFMPQNQRQLPFHIHAGVVVVIVFASRDSISDEHHFSRHLRARREIERNEILVKLERDSFPVLGVFEAIVRPQLGVRSDWKRLQVTLAVDRLQARRFELFGDVGGGFLQFRRAGRAPAHRFGRQKLHVRQIALRIESLGGMTRRAEKEQNK